jgi:hypothetical protein
MKSIELINCERTVCVDDLHYPELSCYEWYNYHDPYLDRSFTACELDSGRQVFMEHYFSGVEDIEEDGQQYWTITETGNMPFLPHVAIKHYELMLGLKPNIKVSSHFGPVMHFTKHRWYEIYRHALQEGWVEDPVGMSSRYENGEIDEVTLWVYFKENTDKIRPFFGELIDIYKAALVNLYNQPKSREIRLINCDRTVTVDRGNYPTLSKFDWYEYHDPYLNRSFAACNTPSGRRVLMDNLIADVDVLDDNEWQNLGGVVEGNDMTFLPQLPVKKYRVQLLPRQYPIFQVSTEFGPTVHLVWSYEDFKIWENNGFLDEHSWSEIRDNCVWRYKMFLATLNQDKHSEWRADQERA